MISTSIKKDYGIYEYKNIKMTFIVAGKIKNTPFILVDKITNLNPTEPPIDKSYTLKSNPKISLTLTGDSMLMDVIKTYDEELFVKNKSMVIDKKTIDLFGNSLSENCIDEYELSNPNSIFFLENNNLYRYTLRFDKNDYKSCNVLHLNNNDVIICNETKAYNIPLEYLENFDTNTFPNFYLKKYYDSRLERGEETLSFEKMFHNGFTLIT